MNMNYNITCIIIYEKMTKYRREQSLNNTWIEEWNTNERKKEREKQKSKKYEEKKKRQKYMDYMEKYMEIYVCNKKK